MRFSRFDRVIISSVESHVHTNGKVAWAVGVEKVELLRKDGNVLSFEGGPAKEDSAKEQAQ